MSDLIFSVQLTADAGSYIGELRVARTATAELGQANSALAAQAGQNAAATARDAAATRDAADAKRMAASAAREEAAARRVAEKAARDSEAAAKRAAREEAQAAAKAANANRMVSVQIGQQLQDAAIMQQGGMSWLSILTTQGSQAAYVLSNMEAGTSKFKGALASAATFIAGPWGAALTVGAIALNSLTSDMEDNVSAANEIRQISNVVADAQSALSEMFDLTTGKIKDNTEAVRLNVLAKAMALKVDSERLAMESRTTLREAGNTPWSESLAASLLRYTPQPSGRPKGLDANYELESRAIARGVANGQIDKATAFKRVMALPEEAFANISKIDILNAISKGSEAALSGSKADKMLESYDKGRADPSLMTPAEPKIKRPARDPYAGKTLGDYDLPFARSTITSGMGPRGNRAHLGVDFGVPNGSAVRAAADGIIDFLGQAGGYGNLLKLGHGAGVETRYAHLSAYAVRQGQAVKKGDIIGYSGGVPGAPGAGNSRGAHLHYEVLVNGKQVDPTKGRFPIDPAAVAENAQRARDQLQEFGDSAAERILRLNEQFDRTPRAVDQAHAAIRDVDRLMAELAERKPPGFEAMIADAQKLGPLIEQSLRQPVLDMLDDQARQITMGQALLANDQSRVHELEATWALMDRLGVESEAQLATELAKRGITGDQVQLYYDQLEVMRQQTREIDRQNKRQQDHLALVNDVRQSLRDGIADLLDGKGLDAAGGVVKRIFASYKAALADQISEALFGDLFRKQEDKIKGLDTVDKAGTRLAGTVDEVRATLERLGTTLQRTNDAIGGGPASPAGVATGLPLGDVMADILAADMGAATESGVKTVTSAAESAAADIVEAGDILVTGQRDIQATMKDALKALLEKVFGPTLSKQIAGLVNGVFQGIAYGQAGSGILRSVGIKQSSTGAAVGGALGMAIGGPIGSLVGGMIFGTIGGLLKKAKTGSTQVVYADGTAAVGSVAGNNAAFRTQSTGMAGNVVSGLQGLAEQLGGTIADRISVSIGVRNGKPVVDTTGQNRTKGAGVIKFAKDDVQGAVAAALADAVADGAVQGISAKVQAALASSTDLDKALREALKVDEIEQIIEGLAGANRKAFVDFERQAKERLRIAGKYGFDLLKIEEQNAKDRAKLLQSAIEQATGGLKAMLEDLATGEKYAGSPAERRAALLAKIETVKGDAASDPDAAAKLSDLLDQLYAVSLEAYGSAGGTFAADRALIKTVADSIIATATAEITAAQQKAQANAGTDTSSADLQAAANASLADMAGSLDDLYGLNSAMLAQLQAIRNATEAKNGSSVDLAAAAWAIGGGLS